MKKKVIIGLGLAMGGLASFIAMLPNTTPTKAAVLVHDEKNIEQSIKEVMQTYEIIVKTQKQIDLMTTNMKSMDMATLTSFAKNLNAASAAVFGAGTVAISPEDLEKAGKVMGLYNKFKSTTEVLEKTIGKAQDVFDGNVSYNSAKELYAQAQKTQKALEATYKDAAETAKVIQGEEESKIDKLVKEALEKSNQAAGQKEVQQAKANLYAAMVSGIKNGNKLLSQSLGVQVQEAYARNQERAIIQQREKKDRERVSNFVSSYKSSSSSSPSSSSGTVTLPSGKTVPSSWIIMH